MWDEEKWDIEEIYAEAAADPSYTEPQVVDTSFSVGFSNNSGSIPYSVLVSGEVPAHVDPSKKEEYLSDGEFAQVFGSDRDQFYSLPAWKQVNLKRSKNLF